MAIAGFVGAILISGALKFMLGLRLSIVGERVILLVRERLYTDHVTATSASADVPTRGTLVAMRLQKPRPLGPSPAAPSPPRSCNSVR